MPPPIGECANCGYVGSPHANGACPKCGGAWKHIEANGAGNSKGGLSKIRIQNPKRVNGKNMNVTTVKAGIDDDVHNTTIKRTVEGEPADIQIKFKVEKDGGVQFLHVHCQHDKEPSEWSKSSGLPIETFYDVSQDNGSQIIRCKVCGKRWSTAGRMAELSRQTVGNSLTPKEGGNRDRKAALDRKITFAFSSQPDRAMRRTIQETVSVRTPSLHSCLGRN